MHRARDHRSKIFSLLCLFALFAVSAVVFPPPAAARPKTDFIRTVDGDELTVEIKELQMGKLSCKTHSMGTVAVEWADIVELRSEYYFRLMTSKGRLLFGSIEIGTPAAAGDSTLAEGTPAPELVIPFQQRYVSVEVGTLVVEVPMDEVVEITSLRRSFWSRIDGSLSMGYEFSKVSDVSKFNFDWRNVYRADKNRIDLNAVTSVTSKGGEDVPRRRLDYSTGYTRRLARSWSSGVRLAFQRNDELGVKARYLGSLGAGYYPFYTNYHFLNVALGALRNAEQGGDSTSTVNTNWEAQIGGIYSLFLYNSPKTNIDTSANFYYGITEKGRYRLDFEIKLRRELLTDFFFDISYYLDYDNRNPTTGTESTDWGIVTGIAWTY